MTKRRWFRLGIPLILLLGAGAALAQVSANYDLSWHVLSGGGGTRGSAGYRVDDSLGQWAGSGSMSASYKVNPGFWPGVSGGGGGAPPAPTATPTPPPGGDAFEADNSCGAAKTIIVSDPAQTHNFHAASDYDWAKFYGSGGSTYDILVDNIGADADAVIVLYDACAEAPLGQSYNAFGTQVQLQWSAPAAGWYYIQLFQNEPSIYGSATGYQLSVSTDTTPPATPRSVRLAAMNAGIAVQWRQGPEPDLASYTVRWHDDVYATSGAEDVIGATNTFFAIDGLDNDKLYFVSVRARDTSGWWSEWTTELGAIPRLNADITDPALTLLWPVPSGTYTTTAAAVSVGGLATDTGGNLSRASVYNLTNGSVVTISALSGSAYTFTVPSVPLTGDTDNNLLVTVLDAVGNASTTSLKVHRQPAGNGVAVIVGGHNEAYGLQTNINYLTNRAYRVFIDAGFAKEKILYLSPSAQDADGDGSSDVVSTTTSANIALALTEAKGWVTNPTPFFLYLMDHGVVDAYCADGCPPGGDGLDPSVLDGLLDTIEAEGGQVNVIYEACHSGSFIDGAATISKNGRVVIASTGADNLAFASDQGAFFSDAFFTTAAAGGSLLTAFNSGKAAALLGNAAQTPWLDDNGDSVYTGADGSIHATARYLSTNFGTVPPHIAMAVMSRAGSSGVISATVLAGDAAVKTVWALVIPPSYTQPTTTTMDMGAPMVQLIADPETPGFYAGAYDGFSEDGSYRVVVYASDISDNVALPKLASAGESKIYLPVVVKAQAASAAAQAAQAQATSPTAAPSPTAEATASPTPQATASATATMPPAPPTLTPEPTAATAPTATATMPAAPPTLTPEPTAAPTQAPEPTATPAAPPPRRSPAPTREPGVREAEAGWLPLVVRMGA